MIAVRLADWSTMANSSRRSAACAGLAAGGQITQTTADLHQSPEVAPWRNGFMVSYHSQFDGGGRGVGQLVNGVGNTVGAPLLLGSTPNQLFAPSVSSNGTTAWFAYTESGTVSVVPADTNGLLGAPSIVGSGFAPTPTVR